LAYFSTSIIASRLGPAKPRAIAWKGAGGCVIVSQDRQLNFSRTCSADQEGRTLLHELLAAAGDIRVSDRELHITLAPLSSPHRTRAAQTLCAMLDQTATIFPGSRLRLRFAVRPPPRIGLAFPARRRHGRCLGPMNGAKPDTVTLRNVRRSES
jgi:hypothetical protein